MITTSKFWAAVVMSTVLLCATPALAKDALFSVIDKRQNKEHVVDWAMVNAIGLTEIETKVLTQGPERRTVRGVLAKKLLEHLGIKSRSFYVEALDHYSIEIPADDFNRYPVVFALEIDSTELTVRTKGPAWIIYPVSKHPELDRPLYEARSVWQVKTITAN